MDTTELKRLDDELNQMALAGQVFEAFDKFYADDVVMQENSDAPRVGKATNLQYERDFFAQVGELHGASVDAQAVGDGVTITQWTYDVTFKNGPRAKWTQAAVRRWANGKVVHERFLWNRG